MNRRDVPLVVHVGYPKTATTTFQQHVFPYHPEIEYLGKFIPSFRYADDRLYGLIDELLHRSRVHSLGTDVLRSRVGDVRARSSRTCALISSESFIHPSVIDIATVADRLHAAFHPCRILITIREQISAILSFYWMHGRYGQYLTIGPKDSTEPVRYPIPFSDWVRFQNSAADRNYLGTLCYDAIVGYYMEKFGSDNVRVLLYENFKDDPDGYAQDLGSVLGVDVLMLRTLMGGKHEHQSKGRPTPWEGGHANAIAGDVGRRGLFGKLGRLFETQTIDTADSPAEKEIAELRETYREGNRKLAKMLSMPIAEYGYAV
jgi:hypothetical protein